MSILSQEQTSSLPDVISSVEQLDELLTTPDPALIADIDSLDGDIMVIGASGKMGPTLARLAKRTAEAGSTPRDVIAVARFSDAAARERLESNGIRTIAADLDDPAQIASLPDAKNIVYMLGTKFGTTGKEYQTWATNTYVAGSVARRFPDSRFTVFSSGNIYPLRPLTIGGADETVTPDPVGEYAQSCLARERMFEYASVQNGTPVSIFRLNYAIDLRYGVLWDIASQVHAGEAVDITMGNVNVIWQGDANSIALRCLKSATSPVNVFNVTGPETIPMRYLVDQFAARFEVEPKYIGEEAESALLSNAAKAFGEFGYPSIPLAKMIDWVAHWVDSGGENINKPTHFQTRDGRF